jgi:HprK-related kinase B
LLALPQQELWEQEEKHDVMVESVYRKGRIVPQARLTAFQVLNWQRHSDVPLRVKTVDLAERDDVLGAIMKSPGPFYQFPDGSFLSDEDPLQAPPYLDALADIPVYEVSGGVDFEALNQYCRDNLLEL